MKIGIADNRNVPKQTITQGLITFCKKNNIDKPHFIFEKCKIIEPLIKAIRGGTDGSQLSYKGLPCPNIFAGGHNFHGRYEYVPVESILKATEVIVGIAKKVATKFK